VFRRQAGATLRSEGLSSWHTNPFFVSSHFVARFERVLQQIHFNHISRCKFKQRLEHVATGEAKT